MAEKKETAWYEKAAGKRQHKAENTAKLKARGEEKKRRQEEKSQEKKPAPVSAPEKKRRFSTSVNSKIPRKAMFDSKKLPEDAKAILENFDLIAGEVRHLSAKQQTLLPSTIKKLSHELTDDRSSRRLGYMNDAGFVSAYISYFMWWNLVRLTKLFSNLDKDHFNLSDNSIALDIGSGPLTIPVALWLSRPELRSKKITFYCLDISQTVLAAGEELFLSIAARTADKNSEPWKIIRVKGPLGTSIKEKADMIFCANVFNETAETSEMQSDYLAKKYTTDLLKYLDSETEKKQSVLLIEPADPHSARLVTLMRDAFIRKNLLPLAPCPHIHSCPMEGRTSSNPQGKWCNFAFDTEDAPQKLLKLSEKANLTKERAGLSWCLCQKTPGVTAGKFEEDKTVLNLRIASDFIKLPDLKKSGYYACSRLGLVLAVDTTNVRPKNGDLISVKAPPADTRLSRDKKSGALILNI